MFAARKQTPHARLAGCVFLLASLLFVSTATAQDDGPVYTGLLNDLALGGYDPVAFFSDAKPTKGSKKYAFEHRGASWRFASAENLALFEADPSKYSPQYGGHCAWAMASGKKAPGKAPHWKIVEGKLYLNYSKSVQADWLEDISGFIASADQQWPKVAAE